MIPVLIILAVVATAVFLVPTLLRRYVNKKLAGVPGYHGHVERAELNIFTCSLTVKSLRLNKLEASGKHHPFFSATSASIKLNFRQLLKKEFFGTLRVANAVLQIVKEPAIKVSDTEHTEPFNLKTTLERLPPFELDIFFTESNLTFVDHSSKEPFRLSVTSIDLKVLHFSNRVAPSPLSSNVRFTAKLLQGDIILTLSLEPMASHTTFDMNADIRDINLVLLNSYLRSHIGLDLNRGTFSMATEIACSQGKFTGYLKPMITNLDVIGPQDKGDGLLRRLWEAVVAFTYQALKNKAHDQIASKIKIEGDLENPHVNVVSAVISILKNGFIRSLTPSLEDVVSLESVKSTWNKSKEWISKIIS